MNVASPISRALAGLRADRGQVSRAAVGAVMSSRDLMPGEISFISSMHNRHGEGRAERTACFEWSRGRFTTRTHDRNVTLEVAVTRGRRRIGRGPKRRQSGGGTKTPKRGEPELEMNVVRRGRSQTAFVAMP